MAVRMELYRILIRELNDYQIIELREVLPTTESKNGGLSGTLPSGLTSGEDEDGRSRSFPIVIGLPEAQSIERRLKGVPIKRPQTHDLLGNVIESMGGKLESITITDLTDHTFFATLDVIRPGGEKIHIDSRPSDAIAVGIAGGVPIYVEEHVLDAATRDEQ